MRRRFASALSRGSAIFVSAMSLAACAARPPVVPGEPPPARRGPVVVTCTRTDVRTGLPVFEPSANKGGLAVKTDEHGEIHVDGWPVGNGTACVEVYPGEHLVRVGAGDSVRRSLVSIGPGKSMAVVLVRDVSRLSPGLVEDLAREICAEPESAATSALPAERR